MGYFFEDLIRRFSELSNETAGEHFTPREVIKLMVNLLVAPDADALSVPGIVRRVLDPACGTGGMLSTTHEYITSLNPDATVEVYGQELNPESWAICRSDLMIKDQEPDNIAFGNSFSDDGHRTMKFDYMLANPPFGVEWKKVKEEIEHEHETLGESGRFGAGLPRINDGSFLFLQHMISKMKPRETGGSRIAIVFNGSPLFTGAAESGESRIRQWIIENDWLEAIVALPDQLFYNTGISTYFWIVTNRKEIGDGLEGRPDHIAEITQLYGDALEVAADPEHPLHGKVKVFRNQDFGYHRITVERPLKLRFELTDETLAALEAAKQVQKLGYAEALINAVRPLLGTTWPTKAEMLNALMGAVVDAGLQWPPGAPFAKAVRDAIGVRDPEGETQYVRKHFYVYKPPRPLAEIDAELKALEAEIQALLSEVTQ